MLITHHDGGPATSVTGAERRSPATVDVWPVLDGLDDRPLGLLVDPVDDPMVAAAGAVEAFQLETQRMAGPVRVTRGGGIGELDGRRRDLLGQPLQRSDGAGANSLVKASSAWVTAS